MSETLRDLLLRVGGAVLDVADALDPVLASQRTLAARLAAHGWDTGGLADVQPVIDALPTASDRSALRLALAQMRLGGTPNLSALKPLGESAVELLEAVRGATKPTGTLAAPFDQNRFWATFPGELADELIAEFLELRQPELFVVLVVAGVIQEVERPAEAAVGRRFSRGRQVDWGLLPQLVTDPGGAFAQVYGWGGPLQHQKLMDAALVAAQTFGAAAQLRIPPATLLQRYYTPANDELSRVRALDMLLAQRYDRRLGHAALRLLAVPITEGDQPSDDPPKGVLISLALDGDLGATIRLNPITTLNFRGGAQGGLPPGLELLPSGPGLSDPTPPDVIDVAFGLRVAPPRPWRPLGAAAGTRVLLYGLAAELALRGRPTDPEVLLRVEVERLDVVIAAGQGDGFLQRILPTEPQTIQSSGALLVSSKTGVGFEGQAALELALPVGLDLGPVDVRELRVGVVASTEAGLRLDAGATVTGALGPVKFAVERMGLHARLVEGDDPAALIRFDQLAVAFDFKPPSGIGLAIEAGPVTGGGFLFFDPEQEQYAGVVQLSFKALGLTAVGLLTTRLPDGSPGFSLLVIVAAEFPPIQLGFGFTLTAVGGILGVNRTVATPVLQAGVRNRTLDSILFPKDPIARVPQVLSDLRAVFPPAAGRFVLGPMVRVGWGPNALLKVEVALVLELPSPVRLAVLGRITTVLPDERAAVLVLRLDVVGILDFDRGEISVDASLVDSRVGIFALGGDMALRVGWGATKQFALSAGGFHPKFARPAAFPALRRLTIALSDKENPRARLEAYLALTSNTFQVGARLDLYAAAETFVGTFSVAAWLGFDALFQFDPFRFLFELYAGIDVAHNGNPILHASLYGSLSGPAPWRATGYVEAQFIVKFRVGFEVIVGEAAVEERPRVRLDEILAAEVARPESWTALPPGDAGRIVSLAGAPAQGTAVVHPLGEIALRQRALPLGLTIDAYGTAAPELGPERFDLTRIVIGSAHETASPLMGDFAASQFLRLTDEEKLARPAFETMQAGGVARTAGGMRAPAVPASGTLAGIAADVGFTERVIDAPEGALRSDRPGSAGAMPAPVGLALAEAGAAARSAVAATGPERFRGPARAVEVRDERWVGASTATLAPLVAGAKGTSYGEARAAAPSASGFGADEQVVAIHEVVP